MNNSIKGLKIGLPKQYFDKNLDSNVAELIEDSIKELEKLGGKCIDIELPHTELSIPAYYVVAPAECSSNLSRFDGVRFGHRCNEPKNLSDLYCRSRQEGFGLVHLEAMNFGKACLACRNDGAADVVVDLDLIGSGVRPST